MTANTTPSPAGLAWAQRLVRFNTVSRESNLPLIECIADHLRTLGVPLRLSFDDSRRKANLFATLGEGKPGGVILSGHTDTVPWDGQAWTVDPLGGRPAHGGRRARLYGRGSADMKGFIGLVVAQTQAFLDADLPHACTTPSATTRKWAASAPRRCWPTWPNRAWPRQRCRGCASSVSPP